MKKALALILAIGLTLTSFPTITVAGEFEIEATEESSPEENTITEDYGEETVSEETVNEEYVEFYEETNPEEKLIEEASDELALESDEEIIDVDVEDDPLCERYVNKYSEKDLISFSDINISDDMDLQSMRDYNVSNYDHGQYASGHAITKGIDVSKYQADIDWKKAKADGVEFAIIRVGFRGYGSSGSLNEDPFFKKNINGAHAAGIPVGVYMFSQAITAAEGSEEADYILSKIQNYDIELPIVMDFEYAGPNLGRLANANLSRQAATDVCTAFCDRVKEKGYEAMVYADYNMLTTKLYPEKIESSGAIWIARWNKYTDYNENYSIWQFADNGKVNGIKGAVDLDFGYDIFAYQVTLHANGGVFEDGEDITINVKSGKSVSNALEELGISNPIRAGLDFKNNWSLNPEGTNPYNLENPVIINNLDIYAVWDTDYNRQTSPVKAYKYSSNSRVDEMLESGSTTVIDLGSQVALTTDMDNVNIYYTIGTGTETAPTPTTENIIRYTGPITVYEDTNIKAFSAKSGYKSSSITNFKFTVNDISGDMGQILSEDLDRYKPGEFWTSLIEDQTYTGKAFRPTPRVYYDKVLLEERKDYSLSYSNNTNAGTATVNVTGRAGYSGSCSTDFTILPRDISAEIAEIAEIAPTAVLYNAKKAQLPTVSITADGRKLSLNKDYIMDPAKGYTEAGRYQFTISGKPGSNYTGSGTVSLIINESHITLASALSIDKIPDQLFATNAVENADGIKEVKPEIIVRDKTKQPVDLNNFTVTYKNNTSVGTGSVTITAKGISDLYSGSKTATFKITGYPIGKVTVTGIDSKTSFPYDGKAHEIENLELSFVPSKNEEPITLVKDADYSISYQNNIKKGTATVVFTGLGRFTGTLKKNFKITDYVPTELESLSDRIHVSIQNPSSTGINGDAQFTYNKGGITPSVEVKFDDILLEQGKDYTISHSNNKAAASYNAVNKAGKSIAPTIKITGKNSFKGNIEVTYTILPKDIGKMDITVGDKVASTRANQYKPTLTIIDKDTANKAKLAAGTDYDRNISYTYDEQVRISRYNSSKRKTTYHVVAKGTEVTNNDIIPAGTTIRVTASGINNYTGTITNTFNISSYDISKATVKVADQAFKGYPLTPDKSDITSISYKIGRDTVAIEPYEYEIVPGSYAKNTAAGTGSMIIHGKGNYCGTKTVTFKITAQNMFYQVSFFANGGTGSMRTQNVSKTGTVLTNNAYKKNNYEFAGWNTKADGTGTSFENKAILTKVYAGKTLELYAQWKALPYTIKYELYGGTNDPLNPATYTYEDEFTFQNAVPTAQMGKKRFDGWYLDSEFTKPITGISKGSKGNIIIYAAWVPNYEVISLNVNDPTVDQIKAFVQNHPVSATDSFKVAPSLSGDIAPGVLSEATVTSSLNAINNIRYMAGISSDVINNSEYEYKISAGALLNALNTKLSHNPARPAAIRDSKYDSLYTAGCQGARSSNIAMTSWDAGMKYAIINQWMEDSDSSNISILGHRRWLLYPNMTATGFGKAIASNGYNYYGVYAFDGGSGSTGKTVAWPARNTMSAYFASGSAWSLSMGETLSTSAGRIEIVITNNKTGAKTSVKAAYVNNQNYGDPGCIIFKPGVSTTAGSNYTVSVYLHDFEQEVKYNVNFF